MEDHPRIPLAGGPTPVQPLPRLGAQLGFAPDTLWAKRDDLTLLAGGGNKARKLEYLLADAEDGGHDVLLTGGGPQSNHVRMTAAAAHMAGMDCVAVLGGRPSERPEGNLVLDRLLGVEIVWAGGYDAPRIETLMAETAVRLTGEGRHPYEIPLGGASPLGTIGYVRAADELAGQAPEGAIVYTACGTGGTYAGLAVGFGAHRRVRGVDAGAVPDLQARVDELTTAVAGLTGRPFPEGSPRLDHDRIGAGYGAPTDACREALELAGRFEGLVLDPVYSGKAMAGLIADRREGRLAADHPVVFLHTGGMPALFTDRHRASWSGGSDPE